MQIHNAAAKGDRETILRELEAGAPVDALDEEGQTPLMVAVSSSESNLETIQLLLERGANPNAVDVEYSSPILLNAIGSGDITRVQCLLDAGSDINLTTEDCVDALTYAVNRVVRVNDHRAHSIIEFLLERGASVQYEADGESALSVAFENGHFDIVKRLLEAGADETRLEWTPLTRAIVLGTVDDVREQLKQGADLLEREKWGQRTPWLLSLSSGDIEKAKLLLAAGANLTDMGWYQKTALMYPIETNDPEMLRWLLSIGCDVEAAGESGKTPLMLAAERNSVPSVQMLLNAGADPNKVDHIRRNAIEFTSSMEVAHTLLAAGQDINKANKHTRAFLFGIGENDTSVVSPEETEAGTKPRFGTTNPEKMDVPFWHAMARMGESFEARKTLFAHYDKNLFWESCPGYYTHEKYPLWQYPRVGMSLTALPDGRFIEIGGYSEEGGNPNFCIYNEVFVRHPDRTLDIWGYPAGVFPPTDGHSATLVGEFIYIIGCIGYPPDRIVGYTPVYRLNTRTFAIEKVETSGENPGWIFNHKAVLIGGEIHISGGEIWTAKDKELEKIYVLLAKLAPENQSSTPEWDEALARRDEYLSELAERPERFALNLNSFQWRRLSD